MVLNERPSRSVRAFPTYFLLAALVLVLTAAGCRHRSSYRPIYRSQPAILAPSTGCPNGDCGGTATYGGSTYGGSTYGASAPAFGEPAPISSPPTPFGPDSLQPSRVPESAADCSTSPA